MSNLLMESVITRLRKIGSKAPKDGPVLAVLLLLFLAACSEPKDGSGGAATATGETAVIEEEGSGEQGKAAESGQKQAGSDLVQEDDGLQKGDGLQEGDGQNEGSAQERVSPPAPPAEEVPAKQIVVCLAGDAPNLFLYGDDSPAALAVRHTMNENLYTSLGYEYQAQGLEKLPSLADGDARRLTVVVEEGDRVVDTSGKVVSLRKGVSVINSRGEAVDFAGEALEMEQLQADFSFRPLVWSDGTPVSAVDSVISFNVAANPQTATSKAKTGYTESYEATSDLSVRWTGLPGFMDPTYFTNVWTPLPAHALSRFTAGELATLEDAAQKPLSSGPYVVSEWPDAYTVLLAANPYYYRAGEGVPLIQNVRIQFGEVEALLTEEANCDVLAAGALDAHNLPLLEENGGLAGWEVLTSASNVYEQIAFGIVPVTEYREARPDWFGDARVRQAIAMCTDRERMAGELTQEKGEILDTLAPADHPLAPAKLTSWSYDPAGGNSLLDEAGYLDFAEDGRRQDVSSGVPMTITLGTNSESALRLRVTEIFQENMAECGIPVVLYDRPAGTWFGAGPEGPLFGRQFDLAAFAWLGHVNPDCSIFTSDNIPGPVEYDFGGWSAPNVSGWSDEGYDAACLAAVRALPGGDNYEENIREALRLFNEQLPALPLFTNYKAVAVRPGIDNVSPDPTQSSALWNIAEWDKR